MSDLPSISALREHDEEAWDRLNDELYPKALAAARSKLFGDYAADAEDIAAKGFGSLVDEVHKVKSTEDLAPLLVVITYRHAIDFLRSQNSQKRGGGKTFRYDVNEDWFEFNEFPDASDTAPPIEQAHYASLADVLTRAASEISPKVRGFLMDSFYNNKTPAEIAKSHGMREGTVRVAIYRALDDMHEQLQNQKELYAELRSLLALSEKVAMLLLAFI